MTNKLLFDLQLKPHPFPQDPRLALEAWGMICVYLLDNDNNQSLLFDLEWNMSDLIEWYIDNCSAICSDHLSIQGIEPLSNESLSQTLERLSAMHFDNDDEEFQKYEAMYSYLKQHSIVSAFFGVFPSKTIIIGCNHGNGEVSSVDDKYPWVYEFEMRDFCKSTPIVLRSFVIAWMTSTENQETKNYANDLLRTLDRIGNDHS